MSKLTTELQWLQSSKPSKEYFDAPSAHLTVEFPQQQYELLLTLRSTRIYKHCLSNTMNKYEEK